MAKREERKAFSKKVADFDGKHKEFKKKFTWLGKTQNNSLLTYLYERRISRSIYC